MKKKTMQHCSRSRARPICNSTPFDMEAEKKKTYNNTATINDWEREKEGENRERGVERERKGILNEASI